MRDELRWESAGVKAQPIPVITPVSYGIVEYTALRNFIFQALYTPSETFAPLAEALAELARGNATTIYVSTEAPLFASTAITCGDATPENDTVAQLQAFYAREARVSSFSDLWSNWRVGCSGWELHRADRFKGATVWGREHELSASVIGNTADHVTAIWGAKATAEAFPGSVLLTIDSPGHTSFGAPSTCAHEFPRGDVAGGGHCVPAGRGVVPRG
ncbi:hypothetical protein B0H17DRAFT_1212890 [Mycena rosella]|uniref:Peptidase S33 tripeptidyl aminopeptidase-like C-terminal domain-containing protein n=1 Tax=Mycena rosella TaxID=1033263 RepID=A0AAD7CS28_MYCRO|nr:hypothetical protein B0H17DRAFT_1212890 [Mycena rosella]